MATVMGDPEAQLVEVAETVRDMQRRAASIDDIAEQCRMLSLNASIEAARAAQLGKGFAVVAGEMRELARASGEAAQAIIDVAERGSAPARGVARGARPARRRDAEDPRPGARRRPAHARSRAASSSSAAAAAARRRRPRRRWQPAIARSSTSRAACSRGTKPGSRSSAPRATERAARDSAPSRDASTGAAHSMTPSAVARAMAASRRAGSRLASATSAATASSGVRASACTRRPSASGSISR